MVLREGVPVSTSAIRFSVGPVAPAAVAAANTCQPPRKPSSNCSFSTIIRPCPLVFRTDSASPTAVLLPCRLATTRTADSLLCPEPDGANCRRRFVACLPAGYRPCRSCRRLPRGLTVGCRIVGASKCATIAVTCRGRRSRGSGGLGGHGPVTPMSRPRHRSRNGTTASPHGPIVLTRDSGRRSVDRALCMTAATTVALRFASRASARSDLPADFRRPRLPANQ